MPPVILAAGSVIVALAVAAAVRAADPPAGGSGDGVFSWTGQPSGLEWIVRLPAVALLLTAVLGGYLGGQSRFENVVPAFVVGLAWPALLVASALAGPVWARIDPWDSLARVLAPLGAGDMEPPVDDVRLAAVPALAWAWYSAASRAALSPRAVASALALYSVLLLGGALALGRRRWLSQVDVVGLALGWIALLPRGRLRSWDPPRGTNAVLGVMAGGFLFSAVRRSALWGVPAARAQLEPVRAVALALCCAAVVVLLVGTARWAARRGQPRGVAGPVVPAVAALGVAAALLDDQLWLAAQVVAAGIADPLGLGWGPGDPAGTALRPLPLGLGGRIGVQVAVLLAGHVAGAVIARRSARRGHGPAIGALAVLLATSVVVFATV